MPSSTAYTFPESSMASPHGVWRKLGLPFPAKVVRIPDGSIFRTVPQIDEPKYTLPALSETIPLGLQTATPVAGPPLPLLPETPGFPFPAIVVITPEVSTLRT